jgi:hypothetical protein
VTYKPDVLLGFDRTGLVLNMELSRFHHGGEGLRARPTLRAAENRVTAVAGSNISRGNLPPKSPSHKYVPVPDLFGGFIISLAFIASRIVIDSSFAETCADVLT